MIKKSLPHSSYEALHDFFLRMSNTERWRGYNPKNFNSDANHNIKKIKFHSHGVTKF